MMHVDGLASAKKNRAGLILSDLTRLMTNLSLRFKFKASNNETEYEALLAGLRLVK